MTRHSLFVPYDAAKGANPLAAIVMARVDPVLQVEITTGFDRTLDGLFGAFAVLLVQAGKGTGRR